MKIIEGIGLLIILISIINGFYHEFLAKDPEFYISVILFIIGFLLLLVPKIYKKITKRTTKIKQ
jgi:hypothetical protein